MTKKALVLYFSLTGNTTKVAKRFKQTFEMKGWECDLLKIDLKTDIMQHPSPFDCSKYDFFCIGSGIYKSLPGEPLIDIIRNNPQSAHYNEKIEFGPVPTTQFPMIKDMEKFRNKEESLPKGPPPNPHKKITMPRDAKKGIVFITYSGNEFGPSEAIPGLELLTSEMKHLKVNCVGKFSCPGRFGLPSDKVYHKDLATRPNERDLMKAEIFLEEILESLE